MQKMIKQGINLEGMFKSCTALTSVDLSGFGWGSTPITFTENGIDYTFYTKEVERLKQRHPEFTFENENIKRLRQYTTKLIRENYPEDLL